MNTTSHDTDDRTKARPRYRRAERRQIEVRTLSLDQLLPDDHVARAVWAYVEGLDLSPLYDRIKAVEGHVGRDPADPRILVALWLLATVEGIQSARELQRRCERDVPYQWIAGGVSTNYHSLSDFRTDHAEFLAELLTQSVAVLLHEGLVELTRVAQDGMRVRASAGKGSFRRQPTLEKCLREAEEHMEDLRREAEEEDASAEDRRHRAARERAARERVERVQRALEQREEVARQRERRKKGDGQTARASTTDPDARVMKTANGGFEPAYNVQFATTTDSLVIVATDVVNAGGDGGQMTPMVEQLEERYGTRPEEHLADGGFATVEDIQRLEERGVTVYAPVKEEEKKRAKGQDPFARGPKDTDEIAAWRERMGTDEGQAIYRQRAATAEFPNAGCRNRGLRQFLVRGLPKVLCVTLWQALAHNFQRTLALRQAALAAALQTE